MTRPPPVMTQGTDPHQVTAGCGVTCLHGIVPARALNQLRRELPHGTVAGVAALYAQDRLLAIRGIGPGTAARIAEVLAGAGLIAPEVHP